MKRKWIKLGLCIVGSLSCLLSTCMAYSTSSAITYSDNYALTPNSGYNLYAKGDCTNMFHSVCVQAVYQWTVFGKHTFLEVQDTTRLLGSGQTR